jgi:hypothetical protein
MVGKFVDYQAPEVHLRCIEFYSNHDYSIHPDDPDLKDEQQGGFLPVFTQKIFRRPTQQGYGRRNRRRCGRRRLQQGRGWATAARWFANLLRPLAKGIKRVGTTALKAVGDQALNTAGEYISDLATGKNWKDAGQERLHQAGDSLNSKLEEKMHLLYGNGYNMPQGYHQMGGGNKTHHAAVGGLSVTWPAVVKGSVPRKRKRTVASSGPKPAKRRRRRGGVAKKARKGKKKKKAAKKKKTKAKARKTARRVGLRQQHHHHHQQHKGDGYYVI